MKTAVIYYSFSGNSTMVAETIKGALGAEVFEIKTVDNKKRSNFAMLFLGGGQVLFNKKPAILPLSVDISAYDLIILGTPVWAWSPAPALLTFLSEKKINGKKIALFCCHGGGKGKVFEKLKALLPGNSFVGEIDFEEPASKMDGAALKQKISEWVKNF